MSKSDGWTTEWPTEPGFYFHYGWGFGYTRDMSFEEEMRCVQVIADDGILLFKAHCGDAKRRLEPTVIGHWQRIPQPELPGEANDD